MEIKETQMENTLLNLIPSSYIPEVHLSQYDIGRELKFKLMDGNTEYSVPSGAVVTVKATKPSGLGFVVSGTFSGNIVTIVNTETMTNESGRFSAELSISSGTTLLGTSNFIFNIERSPHPEGTTDGDAETLIPELTLLVNEIRESNAKVESMTASATSLPSGSEPTAEYDPDTNNLAFGIPVSEVTAEDLYKAFITKSASGEVASFSDGGDDLPMKSLKVNIVPKQSGSGDPSPSNVRPISGWDAVDTVVIGKNLFDGVIERGTITGGQNADSTTGARGKNYITVRPSTTFYYQKDTSNYGFYLYLYGKDKSYKRLVDGNGLGGTITTNADEYYMRIRFVSVSDLSALEASHIMITPGNTRQTEYAPYQSESDYTTNLPQTVYEGVLDVVSGKLTLIKNGIVYNGSENWRVETQAGSPSFYIARPSDDKAYADVNVDNMLCNVCPIYKNTSVVGTMRVTAGYYNFILGTTLGISTVAEWKTWLSNNNVTVVYELDAPIEIQLTPQEVKTLLGANNIWSDSGSVEVEYRADTTLAYEELANAIISLGGNI